MAIELSPVREVGGIVKANLTTALTEILGEMQNLTEQQRVGESKRRNLETKLERQDKAIQEKKPEIEPKKEQSMEMAK